METAYIIGMFVSIFFHCMDLFLCPIEPSADSVLFIIVATMFLHKLKIKNDVKDSQSTMGIITKCLIICLIICLIMQVLLLFVWFPIHKVFQILVDSVSTQRPKVFRFEVRHVIKDYAASLCVLAIEFAVILKVFGIDDVQRLYGTKDDMLSDSILSIVEKQAKIVQRREARMRRM